MLEQSIPLAFQKDILRAVRILKAGGCSAVFLFGSGVTGRMTDNSDIDLAVQGCPKGEFFRLFGRLLCELEHPVDLVDLDVQNPFVQSLQSEGGLRRVD